MKIETEPLNTNLRDNCWYYILTNCKSDTINLPYGCTQNFRGWDYSKVLEYGEIQSTDKILEIGAFHSFFCIYLASLVKEIIATDNFYWAKRSYAKDQMSPDEWMNYVESKASNLTASHADATNLHYPDNHFDKVIIVSTIEHILDDRKAIKEMVRVLKPGGLLLLTTEFSTMWCKQYSEEDGSYYRVYNSESFSTLLQGFQMIKICAERECREQGKLTALFAAVRK